MMRALLALPVLLVLGGCSAAVTDPGDRESQGEDVGAIVGGKPATAYQEAVLVNMSVVGPPAAPVPLSVHT